MPDAVCQQRHRQMMRRADARAWRRSATAESILGQRDHLGQRGRLLHDGMGRPAPACPRRSSPAARSRPPGRRAASAEQARVHHQRVDLTTMIVRPSGLARATCRLPILPEAPGRFSTTTGWPSLGDRRSPTKRAMKWSPPARCERHDHPDRLVRPGVDCRRQSRRGHDTPNARQDLAAPHPTSLKRSSSEAQF